MSPIVVIPEPGTVGTLPFLFASRVEDANAVVAVEGMPISVWPSSGPTVDAQGRHTTHTGEAPIAFASQLQIANRRIVIPDGPMAGRYVVLSAIAQPFLPHVALRLIARST